MTSKKFETLDGFNSQGDVTISGNVAVDTDTLYVDSVNNRVGIGKTTPSQLLDVDGTATATLFSGAFSGNGANITSVDAVTLDNLDSGDFLRSNASDSFTSGTLTLSGSAVTVSSGNFRLSNGIPLRFGSSDTPGVNMTFNPNELQVNGSNVDFDSGTLFVDTGNNRVGVGKINPSSRLDVNGTVTATAFSGDGSGLSGISTDYINDASFNAGNGILSLTGVGSAGASVDLDGRFALRTLSLSAGNGLTGGGDLTTNRTFNVGEGDGISVSADAVAVDSTVVRTSGNQTINGTKTFGNTIVGSITGSAGTAGTATNLSRSVLGGNGLTGGGVLNTNRTLSVGEGDGISVSADAVAVDSTVVRTSRKINTSGIATGGGNLSTDRTINVPGTNLGTSANSTTRSVTSSTGSNVVLPAVTTSAAGVMTAADKSKLNGIASGAEVNVGTNLGTSANSTTRTVTSSTGSNVVLPAVTTSAAGVMTAADKTKLNGISVSNSTITIDAGNALTGGGSFNLNQGAETITINHQDTSGASSVNNSGGTVVQDVSIDTYGHVTGFGSVNLDSRYLQSVNLDETYGTTSTTITNTGGTNAVILAANTSIAGLVTTANQEFSGIKTAPDFVANSDEKLKIDIESLDVDICLDNVLSLRPTSYHWKENGEYDTGLIAQEVEKVLEHRVHKSEGGTLAVSYAKIVTELIGAVQSQNKTISLLKEEIEELKGKI